MKATTGSPSSTASPRKIWRPTSPATETTPAAQPDCEGLKMQSRLDRASAQPTPALALVPASTCAHGQEHGNYRAEQHQPAHHVSTSFGLVRVHKQSISERFSQALQFPLDGGP